MIKCDSPFPRFPGKIKVPKSALKLPVLALKLLSVLFIPGKVMSEGKIIPESGIRTFPSPCFLSSFKGKALKPLGN
jgi:hypothetical protein